MKRKKQKPQEEKHVSAKTRSEVLADIQQLEKAGETNELRGYLIQLAKWGEKPQQYENIFRGYLYSPEVDLCEAAVFSLLYALQIRNEEYRACALKQLLEVDDDGPDDPRFDARLWAAASLAMAYQSTKDRKLLQVFFTLLDNDATDELLKGSLAGDILLVWGVSSKERLARNGYSTSLKATLRDFAPELDAARSFIAI